MSRSYFLLSFVFSLSGFAAPMLHFSSIPEAGSLETTSVACHISLTPHRNTDPGAAPGELMSLADVTKYVTVKGEEEKRTFSVTIGYGISDIEDLIAEARREEGRGASIRLAGLTEGDKIDTAYWASFDKGRAFNIYRSNHLGITENRSAEAQRLKRIIVDLCR